MAPISPPSRRLAPPGGDRALLRRDVIFPPRHRRGARGAARAARPAARAFLIVLSSRVSHEKDPETVLQAVAFARARGLNAVLFNLGGGYREFQALAAGMGVPDAAEWVLGRPAAHPMKELADYYRAANVLVQGSLEEGLGSRRSKRWRARCPRWRAPSVACRAPRSVATLTPRRDAVAWRRPSCRWRRTRRGARAGAPRPRLRGAVLESRAGVRGAAAGAGPGRRARAGARAAGGARMTAVLPRVALISDLREEQWHSMDLVSELLLAGLRDPALRAVDATELCPRLVRRATRLPWAPDMRRVATADRIVNRFWDYPRWLRSRTADFDLFHIVDHSYAHLAVELPAERTLGMCHDLDAFEAALPGAGPRSPLARMLASRLLAGIRRAARVVCGSRATRDALVEAGVVPGSRSSWCPTASIPRARPAPTGWPTPRPRRCWPDRSEVPELLHVGSVAAQAHRRAARGLAAARTRHTRARLVRVGGRSPGAQRRRAAGRGRSHRHPAVHRSLVCWRRYRRAAGAAASDRRVRAAGRGGDGVRHAGRGQPAAALSEAGGFAAVYRRVRPARVERHGEGLSTSASGVRDGSGARIR